MQVEADHRPVRRRKNIEIAVFPRRRSRSGTNWMTAGTCCSSIVTSKKPVTSTMCEAWTGVPAATSQTRSTPS